MKKISLLIIALIYTASINAQNPTWADDVACIVYTHCSGCHNPNGSGPFSLLSYNDAVLNANYMKIKVEEEEMPPWPIDNSYREFAHARNLTEQEKATFIQWVNTGKEEGNPANAPAAPVFNSSVVITQPDMILQMPTYTIPTITEDLYRCFVLPTGLNTEKNIVGIEIIPGNNNVVHHAQVFWDTTGICQILDNNDPNPGYTSAGGVGTQQAVLLGTWVPGSSPIFVPQGMGKNLPNGAKIVIQIHYPEYSSGEVDSTKVRFLFTNNAVRNISDAPILNHVTSMTDGPLFIPANTVKTFHQEFFVPANVTILNVGPHGHLICKSMKAFGVTLQGDTIPIINIPEWDFHWQGSYDFKNPIKIPIGTTLYGEATYDNTSNNDENPNNPPQDVSVGEATTDEMMLFYFSYLLYQNGDENIVVDSNSHKPHHLNCVSDYNSSVESIQKKTLFSFYPNPSSTDLTLELKNHSPFKLELLNALGQIVHASENKTHIDLNAYSDGLYLIRLYQDNHIQEEKLQILR
ncbi:MAG: T9SS type A sorting domain-containing protein [Bacteroidia bacterium]